MFTIKIPNHIAQILIHATIWLGLFIYPFVFHFTAPEGLAYLRIALSLGLMMSLFYLNLFILIPRFLREKRFVIYIGCVLGIIILNAYANAYIQVLMNPHIAEKPSLYNTAWDSGLMASVAAWVVSSGLRITGEWFKNEKYRKNLEHERLRSELSFLKMQVNPHFLFNALNNIYALEHKKSAHTGEAILKLSELVRYMLYETSTEKVALDKELDYIDNYVGLQKLSLEEGIRINLSINGATAGKKIEPMLLVPLVENAFKHGINYTRKHPVNIHLDVEGPELILTVENHFEANHRSLDGTGGIGLVNLRKRLELLYPNRHELTITQDSGIFRAVLKLDLNHD